MGSGPCASFGLAAPTLPVRKDPIDVIRDSRLWKSPREVFDMFIGPPKAEDPTHVRLQEMD